MIKKQYIKSRKTYKITFQVPGSELPAELEVENLALVGNFNSWDETTIPMEENARGIYKAQIEIEPGQQIRFRYLANGTHWFNAWDADDYVPNGHGSDDCIVHTNGNVV